MSSSPTHQVGNTQLHLHGGHSYDSIPTGFAEQSTSLCSVIEQSTSSKCISSDPLSKCARMSASEPVVSRIQGEYACPKILMGNSPHAVPIPYDLGPHSTRPCPHAVPVSHGLVLMQSPLSVPHGLVPRST